MNKVMALALGLGKFVLLASAAGAMTPTPTPTSTQAQDARMIATNLSGQFDTQTQYDAAVPELKVPPSVTGRWLDRQHATMTRVDAPAIGAHIVYLEWRSGGPSGPLSRQRIWAFDDTPQGVRMRFYTIARPERFAGRAGEPALFRALTPADLTGYPPECAVRFNRTTTFTIGRIDPQDCRIVAQSGRAMRLDVTIAATVKGFTYQEKGILDSGGTAFAVPPTEAYCFERVGER